MKFQYNFEERGVKSMRIETQTIERLRRIAARMETAQENTLVETFNLMNISNADKTEMVNKLLAISSIIDNCRLAREIDKTMKQNNNLQVEDYLSLAIDMVAISEYLSEDDYKRVFREVDVSKELSKSVMEACKKIRLEVQAKELLWFISEGAPLFYWTAVDANTVQQDVWHFELVKTEEEFQNLLQQGKRELIYEKFHDIRICYGTRSSYCDPDEKESAWQSFQSIAEGKEEFYDRALNLLFPDKYTVGNYYVYIPTM